MSESIKAEVNAAFHRFLRSFPHEMDPASEMYAVVRHVFANGYCMGAQAGVRRMGEEAVKVIKGTGT